MRFALWIRRGVYLCALTGALLAQIFDIGWIFHYLFIFVLTLPALSLLLSLPGIRGLHVTLSASCYEASRDSAVSWSLTAGNCFGLPVSCVTARVRLRCPFNGAKSSFPVGIRGVAPGASASWTVNTTHCGLVECSVSRLRVWDCLGIFSLPLAGKLPLDSLLILPRPEEPEEITLPEGTGSPVPVPKGMASTGEDYELRPYRPGDSLRSVHWKMSAKRDELVTRELLAEKPTLPVLTFDHFGGLDKMDRVLDRLAGYSRALLERERPHAVRWVHPQTGQARERLVGSEQEWLQCLAAIYADPLPREGTGIGVLRDSGCCQIHITTGDPPCSNA